MKIPHRFAHPGRFAALAGALVLVSSPLAASHGVVVRPEHELPPVVAQLQARPALPGSEPDRRLACEMDRDRAAELRAERGAFELPAPLAALLHRARVSLDVHSQERRVPAQAQTGEGRSRQRVNAAAQQKCKRSKAGSVRSRRSSDGGRIHPLP